MNCEDIYLLLSDYFDEELDSEICDGIEEHISTCRYCESLFDTFSKTLDLCKEIELLEVPQEVHIRISRSIRIEIKKRKI